MLKDAFEDYKRYKSDNIENNRQIEVGKEVRGEDGRMHWQLKKSKSQNIMVGSIIKIKNDQTVPCDIVIINTSEPKGLCYVETKNLDGETNLKNKQAHKSCVELSKDEQ